MEVRCKGPDKWGMWYILGSGRTSVCLGYKSASGQDIVKRLGNRITLNEKRHRIVQWLLSENFSKLSDKRSLFPYSP